MNLFEEQTYRTLRIGIVLMLGLIIFGVLGFMIIEDLDFVDAFYMTIISVSTVGFEVVKPLSAAGKIFVSILIIFSLGNIAYVGSSLVRFFLDGEFINYLKTNRVNKKIEKLTDHVIICGFGRNGEQAALELMDHNQHFVIIEKRDNVIERIREDPNLLYVRGDATHEDDLRLARIDHARALIATTPNDADNVFVVLTARSMNPNLLIISRASEIGSDMKLRRAGATNVIMPERMGGQRMARLVTQPDVVEFVEYVLLQRNKSVSLTEVPCSRMAEEYEGKTIGDLRMGNITGATIVGLKNFEGKYVFNPGPGHMLSRGDKLFVLGSHAQVTKLQEIIEQQSDSL
jgi:voltage-gated potassium channel